MAGKGNKNSGSARRPRKEKDEKAWQKKGKRKFCIFCKERIDYIDYKDTVTLRKFTSERGKIRARRVTGNCVQHQRDVARPSRTRGRWRCSRTRRDEDHPPEARRQARCPRRHRRGCRRLRAQLPGPSGPGSQGQKGMVRHAESLLARHVAPVAAEGRVRGDRLQADLVRPVTIAARAGEEGKLFGSVTADQIATAVAARPRCRSTRRTSAWTSRSVRSARTRSGSICSRGRAGITVEVVAEGPAGARTPLGRGSSPASVLLGWSTMVGVGARCSRTRSG